MHYDGIQCFKYVELLYIGSSEACFRNRYLEISDFPYLKNFRLYSTDDHLNITLSNLDNLEEISIHNPSMPNLIDNGTVYGKVIIKNVAKLEKINLDNSNEFKIDSCKSLHDLKLFRVAICSEEEIEDNCPNLRFFSHN